MVFGAVNVFLEAEDVLPKGISHFKVKSIASL